MFPVGILYLLYCIRYCIYWMNVRSAFILCILRHVLFSFYLAPTLPPPCYYMQSLGVTSLFFTSLFSFYYVPNILSCCLNQPWITWSPRCSSCCCSAGRENCGYRSGMFPCLTRRGRRSPGTWSRLFLPENPRCAASWSGGTSRLCTKGRKSRDVLILDCIPDVVCPWWHF